MMMQAKPTKGSKNEAKPYNRKITRRNIQNTRNTIETFNGNLKTNSTIWQKLQNPDIRIKVWQFLLKTMHRTQKIGSFWTHISGYKECQICQTCHTLEFMKHILTFCNESAVQIIWDMAKDLSPARDTRLEASLGEDLVT